VAAFAVKHLKMAYVRGQFNRITGAIVFDPDEYSRSSVEAVIDVSNMTKGIRKRDEHVLSPDFFDAGNHPLITFQSTKIEIDGQNKGKMSCDLTIRGITHPVIMEDGGFMVDKGVKITIDVEADLRE
jgi:polyisoprenoid-binding protein YceI